MTTITNWVAGADIKNPNCDMTLSDGTTTVGLMLADRNGRRNPLAIKRMPYPRQSTKIATTDNKYSNLEPPYYNIMQDDWSGGRGALNLEEDTTRYADSYRAWTDQANQITNGPLETYCQSFGATYRQNFQSMPGSVNFTALMDTNAYLAHKFTTVGAVTTGKIALIIKRVGSPTSHLHVSIYSDAAGSPNTSVAVVDVTTTYFGDTVSKLYEATLSQALSATTDYWVVVCQASGTPTTANHWEVGTNINAATDTKKSADGTTWSAASYELYYRVIDNSSYDFRFFEYKRAIYALEKNNGYIFVNGYRGAADDNASHKHQLKDATSTWAADDYNGGIVLITKGPGASDTQPWRFINDTIPHIDGSDPTEHSLQVSADWTTTHTTDTEYVILGTNGFIYRTTVPVLPVTDIAVSDEFVYFATGSGAVYRYIEHNVGGVWTMETITAEGVAKANKLKAINTPSGWELWGGLDNSAKYSACVWRAKIPDTYSATADLYNLVQVLDDGKGVWDERSVSNVTVTQGDDGMAVTLAAGFSTGLACSKAIPSTDLTKGTKIGMLMKTTVATLGTYVDIKLDDTQFLGRNYTPDNVWHYDTEALPTDAVKQISRGRPTSVIYFDASEHGTADAGWHPIGNLSDGNSAYTFQINWVGTATEDYLYVSYPERFSGIYVQMPAAGAGNFNTASSLLSGEYWDGDSWASLSTGWVDGTIASAGKSLGQSGLVYWTTPVNWNIGTDLDDDDSQASHLAADRFHARFKVADDMSGNVDLLDITCYGNGDSEAPAATQFVSLKNIYDADYSGYASETQFYNKDALYIRYSKRFNRIEFNFYSNNNNASTMAGYYWNGSSWVSCSITDGTASGGATLAADGAVTFTMPSNWQAGCPSYLTPYLSETDYIIKLIFTTDAALIATPYLDSVSIQKISLEDSSSEDLFNWEDMNNAKDGDTTTSDNLNLTTDDYCYVMHSVKFDSVVWTLSALNAVDTTMSAQYFNGYAWTALSIVDGTSVGGYTLHKSGYGMGFDIPYDWQPVTIGEETGYAVRFYPADDLTPGTLVSEIYVTNNDAVSVSVPAMPTVNTWYYHEVAITPNAFPMPDESKIISIGLDIDYDFPDAVTITIGKIELIKGGMDYFKLGNERINKIEGYGEERTNPWVFTESSIYEIQTQNDNSVVPMPLREIASLRSELNGQASTQSNVYLVFNLGSFIEKYYQRNLDDVGPNRDEGLPSNRQGDPVSLIGYPGGLFLAMDAKTTGYSSILLRRESGWHEIYRGPYGCPIHDQIIQVIPYMSTRLWISQENDILWIPLPTGTNLPSNDTNFRYTHESVVTTGWISVNFLDITKFWRAVKLYTENLSGTSQYIECEYQTEDGGLETGTQWTDIVGSFETSPFEEELISSSYNVTARRIRFRFKLFTTSMTEAPIIKAMIFDAILRFPVKYVYSCTIMLEDHKESLLDKDMTFRVETDTAQIATWSDAPTVLTMRCNYSPYDNKKVVIEPLGSNPIAPFSSNEQYEKHLATVTLLEV